MNTNPYRLVLKCSKCFFQQISELNYKYMALKPLSQINWNLVGSIYGRSSIKTAHFVPIHKQTWPPQAIIVSDWQIFKNLLLWNRMDKWTKLSRKHLWKVLYGNCSFRPNPLTNTAATVDSCFWLANFFIFFFTETVWPMNPNLVGSIYGKSSVAIAHFVLIR